MPLPWSRVMTDQMPPFGVKARRAILTGVLSTSVAWYCHFLYMAAAVVVFGHLFLPYGHPWSAGLTTVAVYGTGIAARPLGAVIFGNLADLTGRYPALAVSVCLTAAATGLMAFLPSWRQIGVSTGILLVVLRLVQELGSSGVSGSATVCALESVSPGRRGLAGSLPQIGVICGGAIAFGVLALLWSLLPAPAFYTWGWRIAFLAPVILLCIWWWAKESINEAQASITLPAVGASIYWPLRSLVLRHRRRLLIATGVALGTEIAFSAMSIGYFHPRLLATGMSQSASLIVVVAGLVVFLTGVPLCGALSDWCGRQHVMLSGVILTTACTAASSVLQRYSDAHLLSIIFLMSMAGFAALVGPQPALLAPLFPTSVRVSAIGLSSSCAAVPAGLLGATLTTSTLTTWSGSKQPVTVYALVFLLVSAVAVLLAVRVQGPRAEALLEPQPDPTPSPRP
ncbi:MFS transporter [Streptomyces sp. NPDC059003]|uniref:MFS transporter n=1 Tax=Streptomyces sp. NPDC059003 TaxID=3346691 RepID=UPI0036B5371B